MLREILRRARLQMLACVPGCGSSISHAARGSCSTGLRGRWDRWATSVEINHCCGAWAFAIFSLHMKIFLFAVMAGLCALPVGAQVADRSRVVVLHAARMLDVAGGRIVAPGG